MDVEKISVNEKVLAEAARMEKSIGEQEPFEVDEPRGKGFEGMLLQHSLPAKTHGRCEK